MSSCLAPILRLATILLLAPCVGTHAQDDPRPRSFDFASFKIIAERNIFNASRSSRPASTENPSTNRSPRIESFTLVGTLGDGAHWTAFFDGTRSEFRGRLRPDDTIGGYILSAITNSGVRLENGTNHVQLRVGMQLHRIGDGAWTLADRSASPGGERNAPSRNSSTSTTSDSGSAENDVLLRLRQQRERELQ